MEYRTISAKLPSTESTMFRAYCKRKGETPASLIRKLILSEMKVTVPHTIAGKNKISYDKSQDSFSWFVELDIGNQIEILKNISPEYIENLHDIIEFELKERSAFIQKEKADSVPVPADILRKSD